MRVPISGKSKSGDPFLAILWKQKPTLFSSKKIYNIYLWNMLFKSKYYPGSFDHQPFATPSLWLWTTSAGTTWSLVRERDYKFHPPPSGNIVGMAREGSWAVEEVGQGSGQGFWQGGEWCHQTPVPEAGGDAGQGECSPHPQQNPLFSLAWHWWWPLVPPTPPLLPKYPVIFEPNLWFYN